MLDATSEARGLKIGMYNPYMDGSKVMDQILMFCLEAEIFYIYVYNSSHNFKAREKFIQYYLVFKHLAKSVALKLFSSFKIDRAMNFLSRQALGRVTYFSLHKKYPST